MRTLIIFVVVVMPVAAQAPMVKLANTTRVLATDFQVGDHFQVTITGAPGQPVSVRTMRQGRTDWGPVIGHTDAGGRWSTTGQFAKEDFGGGSELWTVGGKLAKPMIDFSVDAPCIPGGHTMIEQSGPFHMMLSCETAAGQQSFITPSDSDSFRTPDGRVISGSTHSNMTAEQYRMEILQYLMGTGNIQPGKTAAEVADLVPKMIGVNALTENETKGVLLLIRAAYAEGPFRVSAGAKPAMLLLLQRLATETEQPGLKRQISETTAFVQAQ